MGRGFMKKNKTYCRFLCIVFISMLVAPFVHSYVSTQFEQKKSSYWYKISRDGVGFAYLNIVISCDEDGRVIYESKKHTKSMFNSALHDMHNEAMFVCDSNLVPLAFSQEHQSTIRHKWVEGVVKGKEMQIKVKYKDGFVMERRIPFEGVYYDIALPDLIIKRRNKKRIVAKLFDAQNLQVVDAYIDIVSNTSTHIQAIVTSDFRSVYNIKLEGREIDIFVEESNLRICPTEETAAKQTTYLEYKEAVKSNKIFADTSSINSALVRIEWANTPFSEFAFEDNRQKIEHTYVRDEKTAVILRLQQTSGLKKTSQKLQPSTEQSLLSDTLFIKPSDVVIKKVTAGITKQHKDEVGVVEGILEWITANIEYKNCIETLDATEIIRYKQGKCTEYAILFASMARCAGIPTKVVLGELYKREIWILHMWNEVWLGQWISLDPTQGGCVSGISHIKLGEGTSLAEILPLRMALIDNMSIYILDYSSKNISDEIIRENLYDTYYNHTSSWKISTPNKSWTISKKLKQDIVTISMANENNTRITLKFFDVPYEISSKTLLNSNIKGHLKRCEDAQVTRRDVITISGQKAPRAIIEAQIRATDYIYEYCVITNSLNVYLFEFEAQKKHYEQSRKCFGQILGSFEIFSKK